MPDLTRFKLSSKFSGEIVRYSTNGTLQTSIPPPPPPYPSQKDFDAGPIVIPNVTETEVEFDWSGPNGGQQWTHGAGFRGTHGWHLVDVEIQVTSYDATEDCLMGTATLKQHHPSPNKDILLISTSQICMERLLRSGPTGPKNPHGHARSAQRRKRK